MNRKILFGAVVAGVLAAVIIVFILYSPGNATLTQVDDLHMKMSPSSLGELEGIIRSSAGSYTRERAVSVYADIASRSGNEDRALSFLKDVAITEADTEVRTAAYTNYYWIREETGTPAATTVGVNITGEVRPGSEVELVLTVTSTRGSNLTTIGLAASPLNPTQDASGNGVIVDANAGKGALTNLRISPANRIKKPLPANISVEFPYRISITGPGQAVVESVVEVRYDQLDYDVVKKRIVFDAESSGGSWSLMDPA